MNTIKTVGRFKGRIDVFNREELEQHRLIRNDLTKQIFTQMTQLFNKVSDEEDIEFDFRTDIKD